jgi:gliding motility-associated-like protein
LLKGLKGLAGLGQLLAISAIIVFVIVGPSGVQYRWSDGSTSATLKVQQSGAYSLTLTACETQVVSRRVAFTPCLVIPNVITPNGDGVNDRFHIKGLVGDDWQLVVYNRWGQPVYQAANYRQEWGEKVAPGLYFYLLRQTSSSAKYKGWVEALP